MEKREYSNGEKLGKAKRRAVDSLLCGEAQVVEAFEDLRFLFDSNQRLKHGENASNRGSHFPVLLRLKKHPANPAIDWRKTSERSNLQPNIFVTRCRAS